MYSSFKGIPPDVVIVWGCDPNLSYERTWLLELLRPYLIQEEICFEGEYNFSVPKDSLVILVESGRFLDETVYPIEASKNYLHVRNKRINQFSNISNLIIFHIGDEQGLDGDLLYPSLSPTHLVLRQFEHNRFQELKNIKYLPLGPTRWTLINSPWRAASSRRYSWSFVGTDWPDSDRKDVISKFTSLVHNGFVHEGTIFGSGISRTKYVEILLNSVFVLCLDGNYHYETFRFYESLQLGAIPIFINSNNKFQNVFINKLPFPAFNNWDAAAEFVNYMLTNPQKINTLQVKLYMWWKNEKHCQSSLFSKLINSQLCS